MSSAAAAASGRRGAGSGWQPGGGGSSSGRQPGGGRGSSGGAAAGGRGRKGPRNPAYAAKVAQRWAEMLRVRSVQAAQQQLLRCKPLSFPLEQHLHLAPNTQSALNGEPVALLFKCAERQQVLSAQKGRPHVHSGDLVKLAADPVCGAMAEHVQLSEGLAVEQAARQLGLGDMRAKSVQAIRNLPGVSSWHRDTDGGQPSSDGSGVATSDCDWRVVLRASLVPAPADGSPQLVGGFAFSPSSVGADGRGVVIDLSGQILLATKALLGSSSPLYHMVAVDTDDTVSFLVELAAASKLPWQADHYRLQLHAFRAAQPAAPPLQPAATLEALLPGGPAALQVTPTRDAPHLHHHSDAGGVCLSCCRDFLAIRE